MLNMLNSATHFPAFWVVYATALFLATRLQNPKIAVHICANSISLRNISRHWERRRKNLQKTRCFYRIKPISMMRTPHRGNTKCGT